MSQQKVERYKEEKANRKEIMKKQKRKSLITKGIVSIIGLALVFWIAYSAYGVIQSNVPRSTAEVKTDALDEYLQTLSADDEADKEESTSDGDEGSEEEDGNNEENPEDEDKNAGEGENEE